MSEKKPSYRVNFTMPQADTELNKKLCELFERHRALGNLRHWLMELASDAAQRELGDRAMPTKPRAKAPQAITKPRKIESFADLLSESDGETTSLKAKSMELEAYESLIAELKASGLDSPKWNEFFETNKPKKLSDS